MLRGSTLACILSHEHLVEGAATEPVHLLGLLHQRRLDLLVFAVPIEPLYQEDRLADYLYTGPGGPSEFYSGN